MPAFNIGQTSVPTYLNTDTVSATGTYTYDGNTKGQVNLITLTNAITVTFGAPANIVEGATYVFILKAGDTSARSFAWASNYKFPGGSPALSSGSVTSGAYDIITFLGMPSNVLVYRGHNADVR